MNDYPAIALKIDTDTVLKDWDSSYLGFVNIWAGVPCPLLEGDFRSLAAKLNTIGDVYVTWRIMCRHCSSGHFRNGCRICDVQTLTEGQTVVVDESARLPPNERWVSRSPLVQGSS